MLTPWGEISVEDAHTHFFSQSLFRTLASQMPNWRPVEDVLAELGWELPPDNNAELGRRWVAELDRHGVERSVIIASLPGEEDAVAEAVHAFPDRFYGYFMFNPISPDAVERAARGIDIFGLKGICFFPAMHRFSIKDHRLTPLFQLIADRPGTVVFVHQGILTVGARKRFGLISKFDMSFSNPIDLHAVALEYPTIRFVVPHFGAGYFRETLMLGDLAENVYLDTSSSNGWTKYQEDPMDLKTVFAKALEVYGPGRLLFGTDSSYFPRGWNRAIFDAQVEALSGLGINSEEARGIFGGNLSRMLGKPASVAAA